MFYLSHTKHVFETSGLYVLPYVCNRWGTLRRNGQKIRKAHNSRIFLVYVNMLRVTKCINLIIKCNLFFIPPRKLAYSVLQKPNFIHLIYLSFCITLSTYLNKRMIYFENKTVYTVYVMRLLPCDSHLIINTAISDATELQDGLLSRHMQKYWLML